MDDWRGLCGGKNEEKKVGELQRRTGLKQFQLTRGSGLAMVTRLVQRESKTATTNNN